MRTDNTRTLASQLRTHRTILRRAYRFDSEKLLIPAIKVNPFLYSKTDFFYKS
jgi:hypothetical protein